MEQKLRRYGVTPIQCRSLTYLHRQPGPVAQKQLQQHLAVKPSTVNGIVDRLVEKGMLTRSPGGKGRPVPHPAADGGRTAVL